MNTINYNELKQGYHEQGSAALRQHVAEMLGNRELTPDDFSLLELAEAIVGPEWIHQLDPRSVTPVAAGDPVDIAAFAAVIQQVVYTRVMEAYTQEAFVLSRRVQTISVQSSIDETPATTNRGFIVPITKESIFFDRTYLVLQRAAEVGEILGLNKEKRLIDLTIRHDNTVVANELIDESDVEAAKQAISVQADTVLVMPSYRRTAERVFAPTAFNLGNNLNEHCIVDSRLAYRRIVASGVSSEAARKWWFLGDFHTALGYVEDWPLTVTQMDVEETRPDDILRFKVSERGMGCILNPQALVRCMA